MIRSQYLIAVALAIPFMACTTPEEVVDEDFDVAAGEEVALESKADAASEAYTYFNIERDYRRCVSPLCGGYWVSRLNEATTRCSNGSHAARCYVAELDVSQLGLPPDHGLLGAIEARKVLLRGNIARKSFPNFGELGRFVASEGWIAGVNTATPRGTFVKVKDLGIRCITTPCNSMIEYKLNANLWSRLAGLDFRPSGANADEIAKATEALGRDGLIVAGYRYTVRGPAGSAAGRTVTQFYIKVPKRTIIEAEDATRVTRSANWALFHGDVLHNGEGLEASASGATLTFNINGTGLTAYHEVGPNRHDFSVAVDGVTTATVDTNAPDFAFQVPTVVASGLAPGAHTVTLTCLNPICALDYFAVAN